MLSVPAHEGRHPNADRGPAHKSASSEEISDGGETRCTVDSTGQDQDETDSNPDSDEPGEGLREIQDLSTPAIGVASSRASSETVEKLKLYGYFAEDSTTWRERTMPVVRLRVKLHAEVEGHTSYMVECQLTPLGEGRAPISWSTMRRLKHLRNDVHGPLKQQLGAEYERHFSATPFACRSGPPGTTGRLHAWFQSLAACMTAGYLGPAATAHVLEMLQAPRPTPPDEAEAEAEEEGPVSEQRVQAPCNS